MNDGEAIWRTAASGVRPALMPPPPSAPSASPTAQVGENEVSVDSDLDWRIVEAVATRVAGTPPPESSKVATGLITDFESATSYAELLVSDFTGLHPQTGPARVLVISRSGWVRANIAIFRHYLSPVAARLSVAKTAPSQAPLSILGEMLSTAIGAIRGAARTVVSAEIGLVLGFLSKRVLGQYDLVLPEDGKDSVYYVGPNILNVERQFGFNQKNFRLWIALHETAHRAQFTGVPWLKEYFTELVDEMMAASFLDPQAFAAALRRMAEAILQGKDPLREAGLAGVFATEEQREKIRRLQALMCLLEGHGNVVMDTIGEQIIPNATQMSDMLRARRASNGLQRFVFRLLGIDTKLKQYELGEKFVRAVVEDGGMRALDLAWQDPANLPTLEEIEKPDRWLARVGS
jgi:coenzyme F420 biosynthesis associated uncharacterized protein